MPPEAATIDTDATTTTAAPPANIFEAAGAGADATAPQNANAHPATQAPKPDDGKPQRPADVAEEFWDAEKGVVRVAELARSQRDLRTRIARGEHKPPASADGYTLPVVEGVDPALVPADDPLWKGVREAAHARGIPQGDLEAIAAPFLKIASEALKNAKPAAPDPAATEAAYQQEITKLGPNGQAVVASVGTWLNGLVARGTLTADELADLRAVSTANGVRALVKLREMVGGPPIPLDAVSDGAMSQAEAERLLTEGHAKNDEAMKARARGVLQQLEKAGRLVVRGPGGRVG